MIGLMHPKILESNLRQLVARLKLPSNWIFQQHNDPKQRAAVVNIVGMGLSVGSEKNNRKAKSSSLMLLVEFGMESSNLT
jgi:hypothetical protein